MKYISALDLNKHEKNLMEQAFNAAEHSGSILGHKVGCAILCENKEMFVGATNSRSRAIGSTCAERMAVDQMYFHGNRKPKIFVIAGTFIREGWSNDFVCTPCGVCMEMFFEMALDLKLNDLEFLCPNWNKDKILKIKLSELYPQFGKGKWKRI